jgi:hypothetical protein
MYLGSDFVYLELDLDTQIVYLALDLGGVLPKSDNINSYQQPQILKCEKINNSFGFRVKKDNKISVYPREAI